MANRIGTEALEEVIKAYAEGRLGDKHLVRAARNPHLLSDLVVGERELWTTGKADVYNLVHTPDLGVAAWAEGRGGWSVRKNDGHRFASPGKPHRVQISSSGDQVAWLVSEHPLFASRCLLHGATYSYGVPRGDGPGPVDSCAAFQDVVLLADGDVAYVTPDGMVHWRDKTSGPHSPHPLSIGVVAGQVIWTAGFSLWHEGVKIAREITSIAIEFERDVLDLCVVSPDRKHFLYQGPGRTPLFLDGREVLSRDRIIEYHGFLGDGTAVAITRHDDEKGARRLCVFGTESVCNPYASVVSMVPVRALAGHSLASMMLVCRLTTLKPQDFIKTLNRRDESVCERKHDEVSELITCGTEDFAYIARNDDRWGVYRVHSREPERVGPTYRLRPSRLIASPGGKHLAWVVTERAGKGDAVHREFAVLSGDAGRFHDRVIHHVFVDGEYRYLAQDGETHRALAVKLADK